MRNKPNIVQTLEAEGLDLKRRGKLFWGLCPFHSEKTPSFKVDLLKGLFHCFGCGAHGDVIHFIELKHTLKFTEALQYLGIAGEPSLETQQKKKKLDQKREAVNEAVSHFNRWCISYEIKLCHLLRTVNKILSEIKTETEADKLSYLFHFRTAIESRLNQLEGTDKEKFELWQSLT